jgi:hypothetical protein
MRPGSVHLVAAHVTHGIWAVHPSVHDMLHGSAVVHDACIAPPTSALLVPHSLNGGPVRTMPTRPPHSRPPTAAPPARRTGCVSAAARLLLAYGQGLPQFMAASGQAQSQCRTFRVPAVEQACQGCYRQGAHGGRRRLATAEDRWPRGLHRGSRCALLLLNGPAR